MKKLLDFRMKRPRNDEFFGLVKRMLSTATALLNQEMDKPIIAALQKAVDDLDAALKQDTFTRETKTMQEADAYVDQCYRGLNLLVRALLWHPDQTVRKLAEDVDYILKKYGNVVDLPYNEEYGALHNVMQELSAIPAETQAKLEMTSWIEGLTVAIAEFNIARDTQNNSKASYQTGLVKDARVAAEVALRKFIDTINAFVIAFGEENYAAFIDQANVMITDMRTTLKARDTRNENAKETESETTEDKNDDASQEAWM